MIEVYCRFEIRSPRPVRRAPSAQQTPMARLLDALRGREVGVLVRGQERAGRVVAIDAVSLTLAGAGGSVAVIPLQQIASVRF